MGLVSLRFTASYPPYNTGEVAGFAPAAAKAILTRKPAVAVVSAGGELLEEAQPAPVEATEPKVKADPVETDVSTASRRRGGRKG